MIDIAAKKTQPKDAPKLESYIIAEKLGESLQAEVFKGYHKHVPDHPLIIKVLKLLSSWDDQT
ncbi:MAG: hypothetical protein ACXWEU_07675, partial [Methylomonas sp.]